MAVAAVLAERRPSAGAAGVTADLVAVVDADVGADVGAGVGAGQGGSAEAMSWRPPAWRVGILAGSRVRSSPGCAGAARFGIEHGNRQPAPFSTVRVNAGLDPGHALEEGRGVLAGLGVGRRHGQRLARCGELPGLERRAEQAVVANALEAVRQDLLLRSRLAIRRPASFEKRRSC